MFSRSIRLRPQLVYLALLVLGCETDDRGLVYGVKMSSGSAAGSRGHDPDDSAGNGGQAGASDGGAADAGDAGGHDTSGGSEGGPVENSAGALTNGGGAGGQLSVGGATGSAGSASAAGSAVSGGGGAGGTSGTTAGGTTSVGSAGSGGSPDSGPCGDINHNGVQDCDETLTQNARFDAGVANWQADPTTVQVWKTDDARGSSSSGSLALTYATAGSVSGWSMGATNQCLKGWSGNTYEVGARVYVPESQGKAIANISLAIFGNDDCQGTLLSTTAPASTAVVGAWQVISGSVKMPPGTRSVLMRLAAVKEGSLPSVEVRFDDVLFRQR